MKISEISENISHTSKRLRDIEREKKVKPGTDDWFKLWFSLPYLKESSGNSYMLKLERDNRAGMLVLHILNKQTGKRTEVRGKLGYETDGYDPEDKLHQLLDKIGKSANVSDLMNGDVVSINPRHPQGPEALKVAHDLTNEAFAVEPDVSGYQHTALTNPQYTIVVNTPGELDWYKLGQHFANLGKEDPHEYGQAESDMMIVAPNKEQLIRYMQELDRIGAEYKVIGGSHEHPEVHLESNVFTNARMNAIKAGKKEFTIDGKKYKITGDIKDELEAGTNEARSFAPQQTPMQDLVNSYLFFTSFGQMGASDSAKSPDSAEKIKEVTRILSQSHKNLQNLDKQTLEKNKNKILTHIHDMMNYAIAHFKEHLTPDNFQAKRKQINDILTKYNSLAATNENFADGKNPGRKGLAKRMGVNTKASVSSLRKTAKNSSGEKQRMAHWLANMKAGREK